MIVRDPPKPWELLFILRGSIIPVIWPQLIFVMALSALVTWLDLSGRISFAAISPLPFSLIGIALSIFSGFRNSASYERWWEGRKLIGQLVIHCRSLSRLALAHMDGEERERIPRLAIGFAHAFAHHMRGEAMGDDVLRCLPQNLKSGIGGLRNAPEAILLETSRDIASVNKSGQLPGPLAQALEEQVIGLSAVLAGAERIRHTPLPYAYSLLLHRTVYLFCFLLPFGLAPTAGLWTPVLCAILAYTFFGLDALGDELAAPFGSGVNALPLTAIARGVEISISEQLGLKDLPPAIAPANYVLN